MNYAGDGSTQLCSSEEPSDDTVCLVFCKAHAPCRFMCICWFNQVIVLQILWDPGPIFSKNCSLTNNSRIIILSHYGFLMIILSICVQDSQSWQKWLLNYLFCIQVLAKTIAEWIKENKMTATKSIGELNWFNSLSLNPYLKTRSNLFLLH